MFVKAPRGFFAWAFEAGHVTTNPTEGVKIVEVATEGFETWTDDDVAAYRTRWPLGTASALPSRSCARRAYAGAMLFASGASTSRMA